MFGMTESGGVSMEQLLDMTAASINAWTSQAINEALIVNFNQFNLTVTFLNSFLTERKLTKQYYQSYNQPSSLQRKY